MNSLEVIEMASNYIEEKINGKGTIIYEDGSKYVGAFRDSTYNGRGTYTYADESEWTGEWKSGKNINGEGTVKYDNGEIWVSVGYKFTYPI